MKSFDWQKPFKTIDERKAEISPYFNWLNEMDLDIFMVDIWEKEVKRKRKWPHLYYKKTGMKYGGGHKKYEDFLVNIHAE